MADIHKQFKLVYKTSTSPFFPANILVLHYGSNFKKLLGKKLKSVKFLAVIEAGVVNYFFDKKLGKSAKIIYKKLLSSPALLNKIKSKENEISKTLLSEIKTPAEKLFINGKLTRAGEKKFKRIFNLCADYGEYVDVPGFLFQVYLVDDFKRLIFKAIKGKEGEKDEIFNHLLSSYRLTNYENFLFALLKIAKGKNGDKKSIKRIADKYFWLIHDYLGEIVDEKYVQKKYDALKNDHGHLAEQFEKAKKRIRTIAEIKKTLPKDILEKVNILQEILFIYSERKKEVINQVCIYIRNAFEYKYPGISSVEMKNMFQISPQEAIALLKGEKILDLERRSEQWVYEVRDEKVGNGSHEYLKLVSTDEEVRVLKGMPSSPGRVKGKVTVILNLSQMSKFKKGNILVAPYTNVNYLPVMHEAKAILTETGGMTSHAAIVSRELGKPSVVGIKNLISILKDGDAVEVDANKGVVKILKK